jgi:hypothetical protein
MKGLVILLLCLLAAAAPLQAQAIKVITEATLIDGNGGGPIEDAVIVIEGTRISQVVNWGEVKPSLKKISLWKCQPSLGAW